ncbi:MAG TPA: DUF4268 domain-containing protein [Devosiaceae bacterium]|jgi:hypothetical protein|nr:DUF4268 domain-containing protein [Devosiaceae bacterium]
MSSIGRLERVPLREVWKHEAHDFTVWLQHNVDVVNDITGLDLTSIEREQAAGAFSIDLVAEDGGGGKVIIENQLEKSNHDHLGKLITYLSAMNARAAIWIVSEPRPEHVAAMSWLNDSSSADFYLLKIEAVRIGISPPAPLLSVIVKPSEDKPTISGANQEFAERHGLRLAWWKSLLELPGATPHAHLRPNNGAYLVAREKRMAWSYLLTQNETGAELFIDLGPGDQKRMLEIFDYLHARRSEIEQQLGPLLWNRMDGGRACKVTFWQKGGYRSPEAEWPTIQAAQVAAMVKLRATLLPLLATVPVQVTE